MIRGGNLKRMTMVLFLAVLVCAFPARGQELLLMGGVIGDTASEESSRSVLFEYSDDIDGSLAWSVSWVNEGHLPEHHRDGLMLQLWAKHRLFSSAVVLKGGAGPYLYFDTDERFGGPYFRNRHGIAAAFSAAAQWHFSSLFFLETRVNWIVAEDNMDSLSLLAGIGLKPDRSPGGEPEKARNGFESAENEITPFYGWTLSNNNDPEEALALGIEYRRHFSRHVSGTVSLMNEGNNHFYHRLGIAAQLWVADSFWEERLTVGAGFGPYLALNSYRDRLTGKGGDILAGLFSMSVGYRFHPGWAVRGTWHRVITDYDRDADVITFGPSYRF